MSLEWISRTSTKQILKCVLFVQKCHRDKKLPHSNEDYSIHSIMTAIDAAEYTSDVDIHCAAMLKDVLSNSLISYANIRTAFGPVVAEIVKELTYDEEKISLLGKEAYLKQKCNVYSQQAILIECCARFDMLTRIKHKNENDKWSTDYANETLYVFAMNWDIDIPKMLRNQLSFRLQEKGYVV